MKIERTTPIINEEEIVRQETYFKCNFPDDYKEFLLKYNGGIPEKNIVSFVENQHQTEDYIDLFFGFCDDDIYGIFDSYCKYIKRIPENTLPIACDPGGNLFLMSVRGDDYGQIYFWDHENEVDWERDEKADYSNLTFVAKSFTDLLNNLRGEDDLDSK